MAHALGALAEIEAAVGRDEDARAHAGRCLALAQAQGADSSRVYGHGALGLLALGRGEPEEAVEHGLAAERADGRTDTDEPGIVRYTPDLVESRGGSAARPTRPSASSGSSARPNGPATPGRRPWPCAAAASSRRRRTSTTCSPPPWRCTSRRRSPSSTPARRLLHGERLRRDRRRSDARRPLRGALATFERLGAVRWAERARSELRATGGEEASAPVSVSTSSRTAVPVDELTPQELQIALHAARGMTNREVGAALFLAPKTVEHHLSRTFRKLGIRRRVELASVFAAA